jgi:nucleoside-diphosphate-sugar epimerase
MQNRRVMVVGATGKIGKHLVRKLVKLGNEVHGIARFGTPGQEEALNEIGVITYRRDVSKPDAFEGVPDDFDYVLHEAALKFGSEGDPDYTVEMNVRAVGRSIEHFAKTKGFLCASSGNVYEDSLDGATEQTPPLPPSLYAVTRLGGEWMVDYFSRRNNTPAVIHRIFYGYHEEFGVPTDIARQVRDGEEIDLTTGYVNVIWLDDLMDAMTTSHKVAAVPPKVLNLTGTEKVSVRAIAERLGELMGIEPKFKGTPKQTSLLGKADEMAQLLGPPKVSLDEGLQRIAKSVMAREFPINHPTQWEKRKGFGEE